MSPPFVFHKNVQNDRNVCLFSPTPSLRRKQLESLRILHISVITRSKPLYCGGAIVLTRTNLCTDANDLLLIKEIPSKQIEPTKPLQVMQLQNKFI